MNTQTSTENDALATASVALGVAGLLPILPFLGSVAALVCGYTHLGRAEHGHDPAWAGIALGWIGILAPVIALFVYCVVLGYPFPIHRHH